MHTEAKEVHNSKEVILSVMPTFRCDGGCNYCYLGKKLRTDDTCLSVDRYKELLDEFVRHGYSASLVQVYGGNIDYPELDKIIDRIRNITIEKLGITPSFISKTRSEHPIISLNIERRDYQSNLRFLREHPNSDVIVCGLPRTMSEPWKIFTALEGAGACGNLTLVQFVSSRYCDNQYLKYYPPTNKDYEIFLEWCIQYYLAMLPEDRTYILTNLIDIQSVIDGTYNPNMSSHLYITPYGTFGCIEYIENKWERLKLLKSIEEWEDECIKEKINRLEVCGTCTHANKCYTEHFRRWENGDTCCGFPRIVKYVEELGGFSS